MTGSSIAVLVVEDEPLLRMAIVDYLEDAGFSVHEASHADDAIAILGTQPDIRIMFTDIDMPGGMDGLRLAAAVRERWPPIGIVVTSGCRMVGPGELPVESLFLPKPYDPEAVCRALHRMAPC
jgi:CheY-like chemotaxis protein